MLETITELQTAWWEKNLFKIRACTPKALNLLWARLRQVV